MKQTEVSLILKVNQGLFSKDSRHYFHTDIASFFSLAGNLPLHIACLHGYSPLVMLLLDFGSVEQVSLALHTVNCGNASGLRPLHLAVWGRHPNSVVLLLQHGADLSVRAQNQRIPDILPCHSGTTPLHLASVRGAVEIARLLLLSYYERVLEPMLVAAGELLSADDKVAMRILNPSVLLPSH